MRLEYPVRPAPTAVPTVKSGSSDVASGPWERMPVSHTSRTKGWKVLLDWSTGSSTVQA